MYREGSGRAVIGTAGTAGPASCMTVKAREEKYLSRGPMEENYRSPVREKSYREEVGGDRKRARFEQKW